MLVDLRSRAGFAPRMMFMGRAGGWRNNCRGATGATSVFFLRFFNRRGDHFQKRSGSASRQNRAPRQRHHLPRRCHPELPTVNPPLNDIRQSSQIAQLFFKQIDLIGFQT